MAWRVGRRSFVEKIYVFRECQEAVRKPHRHPKLAMIFLTQLNAHPLTESDTFFSDVDRYVKGGAPRNAYQLALRKGG